MKPGTKSICFYLIDLISNALTVMIHTNNQQSLNISLKPQRTSHVSLIHLNIIIIIIIDDGLTDQVSVGNEPNLHFKDKILTEHKNISKQSLRPRPGSARRGFQGSVLQQDAGPLADGGLWVEEGPRGL